MEQFTIEHGFFFVEVAGALLFASYAFNVVWNTVRGRWTDKRGR